MLYMVGLVAWRRVLTYQMIVLVLYLDLVVKSPVKNVPISTKENVPIPKHSVNSTLEEDLYVSDDSSEMEYIKNITLGWRIFCIYFFHKTMLTTNIYLFLCQKSKIIHQLLKRKSEENLT